MISIGVPGISARMMLKLVDGPSRTFIACLPLTIPIIGGVDVGIGVSVAVGGIGVIVGVKV